MHHQNPNGLNVPFYRAVWEWIKENVIELITKSTTQVIELPGLIIETVIALIPKKAIFHFPSRFQTYKLVHIIYI